MATHKHQITIRSLDQWASLAGPKGPDQWVEGRSAKKTARAWLGCGDELPNEVTVALAAHSCFSSVSTWNAGPLVFLRPSISNDPNSAEVREWRKVSFQSRGRAMMLNELDEVS